MRTTRIILHLDERDEALTQSVYWQTVVIPTRKYHAKRDDGYDGTLYQRAAR